VTKSAWTSLLALALLYAGLAACNGDVYLRDGVTNGDSFYFAPQAAANPDPVVQSWIRYSLARSVCQLGTGSRNPARATSFECETTARRHLVEAWDEYRRDDPALEDVYLDDLRAVHEAGFLDEYVADTFARRSWQLPDGLAVHDYRRWRAAALRGHRPETRIIGSWVYRSVPAD